MVCKLSIKDLPIKGKKVLMRVDFNVPLDGSGGITDSTRITAALPSISYVLEKGGSLILMSHLGRPKGKRVPEMSLKPCAEYLSGLLGKEVLLAPDCTGPETEQLVRNMKPGQVLLLENLRFHDGEEHPDKDPGFAEALAKFGDFYVNDAFGAAHRAHSSITSVSRFFPGKSAAGFLMEKELTFLGEALLNPKRPFYAIIGGAKISTKIGVIEALLKKADAVLIGGGMAYTFLRAQGINIGSSIHEDEFLDMTRNLLFGKDASKLILPQDFVVADQVGSGAATRAVDAKDGIPQGFQGVDIGPKTIRQFTERLQGAATVFWNGPLGVFEVPEFAKGTEAIAKALTSLNAITIIGGGDSIAALHRLGLAEQISHLSTGGGASLEYIEYATLPGIEALSNKAAKGAFVNII